MSEDLDFLSVDDLVEIAVGILGPVKIRDRGLLASAASRPGATVFGEDAYPTFAEKPAALLHSLARNHPLVDGNKRLAWSALRAFCLLNDMDLRFDVDTAEALVQGVARGDLDVPEITTVLNGHMIELR